MPLLLRRGVTAILGRDAVTGVRVADLDAAGRVVPGREEEWPADAVVTSAGLYPLVELVQLAGVPVVHVSELGGHVPLHGPDLDTTVEGLFVAGSVTGVAGARVAAAQGRVAAITAARYLGLVPAADAASQLDVARGALDRARGSALPIMPDAERGLGRLAEAWAGRRT
jgi:sarcosine oxidase subunit alpha